MLNPKQVKAVKTRRKAALATPTLLPAEATRDIAAALNTLLADVFALYVKTKNFHWHVSGPHFRDFHELLDEQADQIYNTADPIAERVRKIGAATIRSVGQIAKLQRVLDNDADYVTPLDMLAELREEGDVPVRRRSVVDEPGVDELLDATRDRPVDQGQGRRVVPRLRARDL